MTCVYNQLLIKILTLMIPGWINMLNQSWCSAAFTLFYPISFYLTAKNQEEKKRKILSDSGNFIFIAPAHIFPLQRVEHIQLWPLPPSADNFIITYSFEVDLLLHLCSHDTIIFSTFISEVALLESVSSNPLPPHLLLILSLLSETLHRLTSYFGLSVQS